MGAAGLPSTMKGSPSDVLLGCEGGAGFPHGVATASSIFFCSSALSTDVEGERGSLGGGASNGVASLAMSSGVTAWVNPALSGGGRGADAGGGGAGMEPSLGAAKGIDGLRLINAASSGLTSAVCASGFLSLSSTALD